MSTTSKIAATEGTGKNIATYSLTEDAVTKEFQRTVLSDSAGTEIAPLTVSDFDTKTGSLTETAPATDTASSGVNGRLQRIAQRLTTLIGTLLTVAGGTASGSSLANAPVTTGGLAKTSLPTAVSDAQVVNGMFDKFGRRVVLMGTIRDLIGTQTTTISASTSETTIVTAAASTFNDPYLIIVSNTSAATNTRIDFRDTTAGSILFSIESIGGAPPVGFSLSRPIPQTTVNTNWTAQCATSTTDIRVYVVFEKNK